MGETDERGKQPLGSGILEDIGPSAGGVGPPEGAAERVNEPTTETGVAREAPPAAPEANGSAAAPDPQSATPAHDAEATPAHDAEATPANDAEATPADDAEAAPAHDAEAAPAAKREPPQVRTCPQCGATSRDPEWCDRCGAEMKGPPLGLAALEANLEMEVEGRHFRLQRELTRSRSRAVWAGVEPRGGASVEVHLFSGAPTVSPPPELAVAVRQPLADGGTSLGHARVYPAAVGQALSDILDGRPNLETAIEVTVAVARAVATVHAAGYLVLGLHPQQIRILEGRATLLWEGPFPAFDDPHPLRAPAPHFSAPEAYGRGEGELSPATDVYCLGALFYYLASGAPPIPEIAETGFELPPLRDWRPSLPVGLAALCRRATARLASRRTMDVDAFLAQVEAARTAIARREAVPYGPVAYEIGAETHIGLAKGRQRPINEDSHLVRVHPEEGKALLFVADGVSRADLGTGDQASRLTVEAASERWEHLRKGRLFGREISAPVAENLLASMVRGGNQAITASANEIGTPTEFPQADVMASTAVAALVDGNRVHVLNLGDSRAYLFSGGVLEAVTTDHDTRHELMRSGHSVGEIRQVSGGGQLTRFVGRLEANGDRWVALDPEPDFFHLTLMPGDRFLLCSDGVSDYVGATELEADEAIARVLSEHRDPARAAFELIVLANRAGGGDNITCIVLDVADAS